MWAIKEYREATVIYLYNGKTIKTGMDLDTREKAYNIAIKGGRKTMKVWWILFNVSSFDYAEPIQLGSIELYIETLAPADKQKVKDRWKEMYDRVGKRRESIEQIENRLKQ